ncbi:protein of unknown function [Rhodovastum atsumiense]|nr:protein of unknown function [Rhodovastum atsumiense]
MPPPRRRHFRDNDWQEMIALPL